MLRCTYPQTRAEGATTLAGYVTVTTAAVLVAQALGMDVETDPESSNFLKARDGNTWRDLAGPFGSTIRFGLQMAYAAKNQITDEPHRDRAKIVNTYVSNQSSPLGSVIWSVFTGKDHLNREIKWGEEWPTQLRERTMYMWMTDFIDAMQDEMKHNPDVYSVPKAASAGVESWLGAGVQTYEDKPKNASGYQLP